VATGKLHGRISQFSYKKAILEHATEAENFAVFHWRRGGFCRGNFSIAPSGGGEKPVIIWIF
jgi:hypothetical protein